MFRVMRPAWLVGVLAVLVGPTTSTVRADQIDRALTLDSGRIAEAVRGMGAKSVAVLKFRVQIGNEAPTFRAGTLGADMVRRVENLLILTSNPNDPKPVVLAGAGERAAKQAQDTKGAFDWTTPAGRAKLLKLELPVIWDDAKKMAPDGYVTGTVRVSADMKDVFVDLVGFTAKDPANLRPIRTVGGNAPGTPAKGIRMDRGILTALGQSFTVPRELKVAKTRQFVAAEDAAVTDAAQRNSAGAATLNGPVKLEILYNENAVTPEPTPDHGGELRVRAPLPGQRIKFALTNTGPDRVAVLLTVNGLNTVALKNEDLANPAVPREKFQPWVLEPNKRYEIAGFLASLDGKIRPFKVLAEDESISAYSALSPDYAGKIHMIVYGNKPKTVPVPIPAVADKPDVADDVAIVPIPVEQTDPPADTMPKTGEPKQNEKATDPKATDPKNVDPKGTDVKPVEEPKTPAQSTQTTPPGEDIKPVEITRTVEAPSDTLRELNEGIDAGSLLTVGVGLGKSRSLADAQAAVLKQVKLVRRGDGSLGIPARNRGLLTQGDDVDSGRVDVVKFEYHPLPLHSLVIGYFNPSRPNR